MNNGTNIGQDSYVCVNHDDEQADGRVMTHLRLMMNGMMREFTRVLLYRRWLVAHHLEAAVGYDYHTPAAAGEYAWLAERRLAGCRLGCFAR